MRSASASLLLAFGVAVQQAAASGVSRRYRVLREPRTDFLPLSGPIADRTVVLEIPITSVIASNKAAGTGTAGPRGWLLVSGTLTFRVDGHAAVDRQRGIFWKAGRTLR